TQPIVFIRINPVGHKASGLNEEPKAIHCRKAMLGRESNNDVAMNGCGRVGDHNESAIWCTSKRVEDALNVGRRVLDGTGYNLKRQRSGFRRQNGASYLIFVYFRRPNICQGNRLLNSSADESR